MDEHESPAVVHEVDLNAARPGWMATIAGGLLLVTGLTVCVTGIQLLVIFDEIYTWAWVIPYLLILLGVASIWAGGRVTDARLWASVLGFVLAGLMALCGIVWVVHALMYGFLSALSVLATLLSAVATLVVPLSIPSALAAERARKALYEM